MKRSIAMLVVLCLLAALWGCTENQEEPKDPVDFYYPRSELSFNTDDGVIGSEVREASGHREDPAYLISIFLQGPQSEGLRQIFPAGTGLVSLRTVGTEVRLVLTDELALLTGLDLTLACACLTATVMDLTGAESVRIETVNATLDGKESITMDSSTLLLLDDSESLNP